MIKNTATNPFISKKVQYAENTNILSIPIRTQTKIQKLEETNKSVIETSENNKVKELINKFENKINIK
jgi:hypothetical protein